MKKTLIPIFLSLCLCVMILTSCVSNEKDVLGTFNFVGGWYGSADDSADGRIYCSMIIDGEETFPNVVSIPEGIDGFMNKSSFYIEITDNKITEHWSIQFSGDKFQVNHLTTKEYSYILKRQKDNKNAFDIFSDEGKHTYYEVWENSLTYRFTYENGDVLCLSFFKNSK